MSKKRRRFIFYALVLIFCIAGPLVVAYAFGLVYDFSRAGFRQTGGIFIKSPIPRLSIFLDGALVKETGILVGSALLTDVDPGTRLVRLEKPGFASWSKTVLVEPAAVTEFRGVVLVPRPLAVATSSVAQMQEAGATTTPATAPLLRANGDLAAGKSKQSPVLVKRVHAFASSPAAVWFVDKNGFFARRDPATGAVRTIGRPGFFIGKTPFRFFLGTAAVGVIDSSGGLFLFEERSGQIRAVAAGAEDMLFDEDEERVLIRKERGIDILWLQDNKRQPFEKAGMLETVATLNVPIREARWFYATGEHIVYRTRNGLFLIEIDGRGGRNTAELVSGATDEIFTFSALPGAIFYRIDKTIYKITL